MKILLMDDHKLVREVMVNFLEANTSIEVMQAETHEEAHELIRQHGPFNCILADLRMPGNRTVYGLAPFVEANVPYPVYLFSGAVSSADLVAAGRIGIAGHIRKDMPSAEMARAISRILIQPDNVPRHVQLSAHSHFSRNLPVELSDEDCAILEMVAEGARNSEIAVTLGIKVARVEHRLRNIYKYLGVSSRHGAALFVHKNIA